MTNFTYQDYLSAGYSATSEVEFNKTIREAISFFDTQLKPFCKNATDDNIAMCLGAMVDQKHYDDKQLGSESIAGYSYTMSETQKANAKATQANWAYFATIYCGLERSL